MMTADIVQLLVAFGAGSVIVALIQGFFNRGPNKATAAKLVTDTTKMANDMVREIAEDLRTDLNDARNRIVGLEASQQVVERKLDTAARELELTLPYLEEVHQNHIRDVVTSLRAPA